MHGKLHLNTRLYELNKTKNLITRIEALFTKQHARERGLRREYYSPRMKDLNWHSSQRVYWASGTLVLADRTVPRLNYYHETPNWSPYPNCDGRCVGGCIRGWGG